MVIRAVPLHCTLKLVEVYLHTFWESHRLVVVLYISITQVLTIRKSFLNVLQYNNTTHTVGLYMPQEYICTYAWHIQYIQYIQYIQNKQYIQCIQYIHYVQ